MQLGGVHSFCYFRLTKMHLPTLLALRLAGCGCACARPCERVCERECVSQNFQENPRYGHFNDPTLLSSVVAGDQLWPTAGNRHFLPFR